MTNHKRTFAAAPKGWTAAVATILALLAAPVPGRAETATASGTAAIERAIAAGDRAFAARRLGEARAIFDKALKRATDAERADVLALRLANVEMAMRDPKAAIDAIAPYLERLEARGPETADAALELAADAASRLGRNDDAVGYGRRLVEARTRRSGPSDPNAAAARLTLSILLDRAGRAAEGRTVRTEAFDAMAAGGDRRAYLLLLNNAAITLQNGGALDEAAPLLERLVAEMARDPETSELGVTYFNLAALRFDQRRFDDAIAANRRAVEVLERTAGRDDPRTLGAVGGLGQILGQAGRPAAAVGFLRDAHRRSLASAGLNEQTTILANNLADVLRALGRYEEARALDADNLEARRKTLGEAHPFTETSQINLAIDLTHLSRFDAARRLLADLARSREKRLGAEHAATRDARRRLAMVEAIGGAPGKAAAFATVSNDLAPSAENVAMVHLAATVADKQGRALEAERLHRLSLSLSEAFYGPLDPTTLSMLVNVARAERAARAPTALKTYEEVERRVRSWSRREIAATRDSATLEDVGRVTRDLVGDVVSFGVSEFGRSGAAAPLVGRVMLNWKGAETLERALLDRIADDGGDPAAAALAGKVKSLRERLRGAKPGPETEAARRELALAEAELSEKAGAYRRVAEETGGDYLEIANALEADEAIVDYLAFSAKVEEGKPNETLLVAMTARRGGRVWIKELGRLDEIAANVPPPSGARGDRWRRELYRRLVKPLEGVLKGANRIYVSPDAELLLVPFDGLVDDDGHALIETRDLRVVRTARGALAAKRRERNVMSGPSLAVGGVDYGPAAPGRPAIEPLPGTTAEIKAIEEIAEKRAAPMTLVEGGDADEATLRAAVAGKSVVHLATHGFYLPKDVGDPDPMWRTGVTLSGANRAALSNRAADDGMLYAGEIIDWPLQSADLVTLSACETAQGDRSTVEGLRGLPSALAAAGAKRSLLALWPVSDVGAAAFMARFYQWLASGASYEDAFRETKREAIAGKIPGAADPALWLAFVMIGN